MSIIANRSRRKISAVVSVCGSHTRRFIGFFKCCAASLGLPKKSIPSTKKKVQSAKRVEIARSCRAIRSACFGRGCLRGCLRSLLSAVKVLLFALSFNVWALDVTWIDSNTVQISGYGEGSQNPQTVVTNYIGTCTNCVAISRGSLDNICDSIESQLQILLQAEDNILHLADAVWMEAQGEIEEIDKFRFVPLGSFVDNTNALRNLPDSYQKILTQQFNPPGGGGFPGTHIVATRQYASYADGIYDYANQYAKPFAQASQAKAIAIKESANNLSSAVSTLGDVNAQLRAIPICSNEPDYIAPSNGHSGCSWTVEQTEAVVQLLTDIKADYDRQLATLRGISNNVGSIESNIRSYGEFLRNTLSQGNGTIRIGSDETPIKIYEAESASLYDYNHSNILQRIELLLYNLGYSTNSPSDIIDGIEDDKEDMSDESDMQKAKDDAENAISDGIDNSQTKLEQVQGLWRRLLGLLQSLNGSIESIDIVDFHDTNYQVSVGDGAIAYDDFKSLALNLLRLVFGLLYWLGSAAFIYFFYVRVLRIAVFVGKWASEIIGSLFDDV